MACNQACQLSFSLIRRYILHHSITSILGSFESAAGGFGDHSERNGRGLRSTYVGRSDLYPELATIAQFLTAQHTFGGTRVETMFAVMCSVWDG